MMILRVCLEVFGQVVNAFAQDGDLNFRGSGVCFVRLVAADQLRLTVFGQRHFVPPRAPQSPDDRMRRMPYAEKSVTAASSTCYTRITAGCKSPRVLAGAPMPTSSSRRFISRTVAG